MTDRERAKALVESLWGSIASSLASEGNGEAALCLQDVLERCFAEVRKDEREQCALVGEDFESCLRKFGPTGASGVGQMIRYREHAPDPAVLANIIRSYPTKEQS